jgi:hypothetical protein
MLRYFVKTSLNPYTSTDRVSNSKSDNSKQSRTLHYDDRSSPTARVRNVV